MHPIALDLLRQRSAGAPSRWGVEPHPLAAALDEVRRTGRIPRAWRGTLQVHPLAARAGTGADPTWSPPAAPGGTRAQAVAFCATLDERLAQWERLLVEVSALVRRAARAHDTAKAALAELSAASRFAQLGRAVRMTEQVRRVVAWAVRVSSSVSDGVRRAKAAQAETAEACARLMAGAETVADLLALVGAASSLEGELPWAHRGVSGLKVGVEEAERAATQVAALIDVAEAQGDAAFGALANEFRGLTLEARALYDQVGATLTLARGLLSGGTEGPGAALLARVEALTDQADAVHDRVEALVADGATAMREYEAAPTLGVAVDATAALARVVRELGLPVRQLTGLLALAWRIVRQVDAAATAGGTVFNGLAAEDWPGGGVLPAASGGTLLGVNAPYLYLYESRGSLMADACGSLDTILDDLGAAGLGVGYLRQPTNADVTWPHAPDGALNAASYAVPVNYAADGATLLLGPYAVCSVLPAEDRDAVYRVLHSKRWEGLYALFGDLLARRAAGESGVPRVVLTLLTLGQTPFTVNPTSESYLAPDPAGQLDETSMVALAFHTDHLAATLVLDGGETVGLGDVAFATEVAADAVTSFDPAASMEGKPNEPWALGTLDTRSRYKLHYVRLIGAAVGQLLLDLRTQLAADHSGLDLLDSIVAVEVFNESNMGNRLIHTDDADTEAIGCQWWARAALEAARGLYEAVQANDASLRLPLWLPSLAMYTRRADDGSNEREQFTAILAWQARFLDGVRSVATSDHAGALSWVVGQDYHYYSFKLTQGPGPIARLYHEIGHLRDALQEYNDGAYPFDPAVAVSVSETGASTLEASMARAADYPPTSETPRWADPYPYVSRAMANLEAVGDETGLSLFCRTFQAREVWRRLVTGAAGGAAAAAWHTHIADQTSGFAETGLREDETTIATTASDRHTKPAWWSYQRIVALLGVADSGGAGLSARPVHLPDEIPDPEGSVDEAGQPVLSCDYLSTGDASAMLVIVEVAPGRHTPYAYVLLVDPCAADAVLVNVMVHPDAADREAWEVWKVPTVPEGIEEGGEDSATAYPADSVADSWYTTETEWDGTGAGEAFLLADLRADADPILLLSSHALRFVLLADA